MQPDYVRASPRRGRLWDLRRCTMTPIMSAAPMRTTASTEKLVMAASFHTSGGSSTDLPGGWVTKQQFNGRSEHQRQQAAGTLSVLHVLQEGVLGYILHDEHGTQTSKSEFQNSEWLHWPAHRRQTSSVTNTMQWAQTLRGLETSVFVLASVWNGRKHRCSQKVIRFLGFVSNDVAQKHLCCAASPASTF